MNQSNTYKNPSYLQRKKGGRGKAWMSAELWVKAKEPQCFWNRGNTGTRVRGRTTRKKGEFRQTTAGARIKKEQYGQANKVTILEGERALNKNKGDE